MGQITLATACMRKPCQEQRSDGTVYGVIQHLALTIYLHTHTHKRSRAQHGIQYNNKIIKSIGHNRIRCT